MPKVLTLNTTLFGDRASQELITVIGGHNGWDSNPIGLVCLAEEEEIPGVCSHRGKAM